MTFIEALETKQKRHKGLEKLLSDPQVIASPQLYKAYAREYGALNSIVALYNDLQKVDGQLAEAKALLERESDPEMKELATEEVSRLQAEAHNLLERVTEELAADEDDTRRNVIMEIRAGTGGQEASLFAADLLRMYSRFAEHRGWKLELMEASRSDLGGFKQVILSLQGDDTYKLLKNESGCHRVQRVPVTESSGRIHTSAVTVAVLPEVEEVQLEIDAQDLKVEAIHASGPGGQSVNKVASAIRITHLSTGMTVTCQDEKSQHQNRAKAMRILRSRLYAMMKQKQKEERDNVRRSQIGTGDRSEKIRTYNFPQNRVTDHRANLTLYSLNQILDGNLGEITEALVEKERQQRLATLQ